MMEIIFSNESEREVSESFLEIVKNAVITVAEVMGLKGDWEVSVSLVDPQEIKSINKEYRGVDSITDVLSFPLEYDFDTPIKMLGDIVINLEKVFFQAEEFNHTVERELYYLTVHSMLHLLGYNHIEEADRLEMRTKEKEIMNTAGIFK